MKMLEENASKVRLVQPNTSRSEELLDGEVNKIGNTV